MISFLKSILPLLMVSALVSTRTLAIPTESELGEDKLLLRDPFKRPVLVTPDLTPRTELEKFSIDQIKMMGVLTGPKKMKAMIATPEGKTHFISEGTKMGLKRGVVTQITPALIRVREKVINVLGKEESIDTDILLPAEGASSANPQNQSAANSDPSGIAPGGE